MVYAADAAQPLGNHITLRPTIQNLYNINSCMPNPVGFPTNVCCKYDNLGNCIANEQIWTYDYWEPAAIVEVSCRSGFSHLKPGLAPRDNGPQGCALGPNWFFEARVWASSGKPQGDRAVAFDDYSEYSFRKITMRCQADVTTGAKDYPYGYGIKHKNITFNSNGPGGSSEAYISDNDPSWANTKGAVTNPQACDPGQPNIEACWGNPNVASGWVTHPNQAVAAALAGYRALGKAQSLKKVVTPQKDDWRMSMAYPFIMSASPAAQSMNLGSAASGEAYQGSSCFTPGHAGPSWYTLGQQTAMPNEIMANATSPQAGAAAYIPDGVYIFTYWVRTGCDVITRNMNEELWDPLLKAFVCKDTYKY